jgi:SAM-dependent methyltransferase
VRVHAGYGTKDARLSVTAGYDAIAAGYDEQVRGDDWMRRALHTHYRRVFRPGDRVLDVGCGTGIDAIALARAGVHVVGVDGSAGMIARLQDKIAAERLHSSVAALVLKIEDLGTLVFNSASSATGRVVRVCPSEGPISIGIGTYAIRHSGDEPRRFDGLVSSFASLSSLPDLGGFAADAARLVRPGGRLVLHLLNRFSLWEWFGYLLRRNWSAAWQAGRQTTRTFVIGGQPVQHWLYFADDAYRGFFSAAFQKRAAYGLGALRPPHTVRRIPTPLVKALESLDLRMGGLPLLRNAGRFFVLDLERRPA